jgi:hypothetical protein
MTGIWDEGYRSYLGRSVDKLVMLRESGRAATMPELKMAIGINRSQQKPY